MKLKRLLVLVLPFLFLCLIFGQSPLVRAITNVCYWFEPCESTSPFNFSGVVANSTSSDREQGSASLDLETVSFSGYGGMSISNTSMIPPTLPQINFTYYNASGVLCDELVYCVYLKIVNYSIQYQGPTYGIVWIGNVNASSYQIEFYPTGWGGEWRYGGTFPDGTGFSYSGFSLDTDWHWFEVQIINATPVFQTPMTEYQFYIDGVLLDSDPTSWESTYTFYPTTFLTSNYGASSGYAHWRIDYLRTSKYEEYPPSFIGSGINLVCTSTPYNATFSYGGTSYNYPQNLSVSFGPNTISTELGRRNPFNLPNETNLNYNFQSWTVNGTENYSHDLTLTLEDLTAETTIEAVYSQDTRLFEPNFNIGIGLLGLIFMFLSWFVGYWKVQDEEYGEAFMYWLMLFGIGFGLFTVLLGG